MVEYLQFEAVSNEDGMRNRIIITLYLLYFCLSLCLSLNSNIEWWKHADYCV